MDIPVTGPHRDSPQFFPNCEDEILASRRIVETIAALLKSRARIQ
jgi:hypothetical protein